MGVEFSPRKKSTYQAADGTTFEVMFAADAEIPQQWESAKTGQEGILLGPDGQQVVLDLAETKVPRSHWDMLLERRTRPELEELLQERLDYLRSRRGQDRIGA